MTAAEKLALVQGQLEAYNQKNIEKFCQYFHPEVKVWRLSSGALACEGLAQFREIYSQRFSGNPDLHCEIKNRILLKEMILDEEWVTGEAGKSEPTHVVAIYGFRDGLIDRVSFAG